MLRRKQKYGQSTIEYLVVIIFILSAFLVFQKYIVRAISGRWKTIGDSWGHGRVYDPKKTEECKFDFRFTNQWYSKACYDQRDCDCEAAIGVSQWYGVVCANMANADSCSRGWVDYENCRTCVEDCVADSPMCN